MDELRIVAPFHDATGYSKHARALLKTALLAGYRVEAVESDYNTKVSCWSDNDGYHVKSERAPRAGTLHLPEVQRLEVMEALATTVAIEAPTILLQLPHMLSEWREYSAGPRIGYTMVECDGLRPEVAEAMCGVDVVLAPSMYVAGVFQRHVRRPVRILPDPVDDRLFPLDVDPLPIVQRPSFLFVSVGTSHERKHWRELMHAFAEEFRDEDVGLFIKSNKSEDMKGLAFSCRDFGAWVRVDDGEFSDAEMAGLYRAADCVVGVGHEGFGLPFVEAAFFGKPGMALDVGGQTDFVTWHTGYQVQSMMAPCAGLIPRYFPSTARWATCSVSGLKKALRATYEDRVNGALERRGRSAQRHAQLYTPRKMVGQLREEVRIGVATWQERKEWMA